MKWHRNQVQVKMRAAQPWFIVERLHGTNPSILHIHVLCHPQPNNGNWIIFYLSSSSTFGIHFSVHQHYYGHMVVHCSLLIDKNKRVAETSVSRISNHTTTTTSRHVLAQLFQSNRLDVQSPFSGMRFTASTLLLTKFHFAYSESHEQTYSWVIKWYDAK